MICCSMPLALALLLQHPCVTDDHQVLLKLLQVSKTCREAVFQHCQGRAVVILDARGVHHWQNIGAWIGSCGSLLQSFDVIDMIDTRWTGFSKAGAIAHGLQQAGSRAATGQLQLQSFAIGSISIAVMQALASYSSQHLHCLRFRCYEDAFSRSEADTWILKPAAAAALAELTQLTSLRMADPRCTRLVPILAGLPFFKHLTFCIGDVDEFPELNLPAQLESLHVDNLIQSNRSHFNLQHLTALTNFNFERMQLMELDVLPPQLKQLVVTDPASHLLLKLTGLQRLVVSGSSATATELQQLSSLTALSGVSLSYHNAATANAAAAGWSSIAVTALKVYAHRSASDPAALDPQKLSAESLQHLGRLTHLMHLEVGGGLGGFGPSGRVATALAQLTGLQHLDLMGQIITLSTPDAAVGNLAGHSTAETGQATAGGHGCVMAAIARLPHLQQLSLSHGVWYWPGSESVNEAAAAIKLAVAPMAAAVQLRQLSLCRCDWLTNELLAALASSLVQLEDLKVIYNQQITDAAMPAISSCLLRLTSLDLSGTSVSQVGLQGLSALQQLRQLKQPSTAAG